MNLLGIEIGGTKLQLVTGDESGRISQRRKLAVNRTAGAAGIREQILLAIRELRGDRPFDAIGVGFGGPVDWRTGKICRSHQIHGWAEFEFGRWLNAQTGSSAFVDNDANVAALGEATRGTGLNCDPVFYVTLGSGVGGGLVVDGNIFHGAPPGEAEIGHVRLDREGTTVESRCSGWAMDEKIRNVNSKVPDSFLAKLAREQSGAEARHLAPALAQGDPNAKQILEELSQDMAFGLSHVVHLFHPQVIILGGGLSGVGEPLRGAVESALRGFVMEAFAPGPQIRLAALGEDAVPVGALCLAASRSRAPED